MFLVNKNVFDITDYYTCIDRTQKIILFLLFYFNKKHYFFVDFKNRMHEQLISVSSFNPLSLFELSNRLVKICFYRIFPMSS